MKLDRICIISSLILLAATSCLDDDPRDQLFEKDVYSNARNIYVNAVASLYNYIGGDEDYEGLHGTCRGVYDYNTLTTDEAIIPIRGGDWYDGGLWENMYTHRWSKTDMPLYEIWKNLYKVVELSNKSISIINKYKDLLTEEQRTEYTAEVRAIRAMFYYYIMDLYGKVPVVTQAKTPAQDIRQSERSQVFRFIFKELQEVISLLPDEHSNLEGKYYGRITAPVASFLLAKLALNAEIYSDDNWVDDVRQDGSNIFFEVDGVTLNAWETCIRYCDRITASGYALESDYAANFSVHNETSCENIFTIPMDKNLYSNQYIYTCRSRHYKHGGALGVGADNGTSATISTVKASGYGTDEVDSRFNINFFAGPVYADGKPVLMDSGKPLVYEPFELKIDLTGSPYLQTAGARMAKYEIDHNAHADGKLQENDIVMYRYADVLLMKAEAKTRNGQDGSAELNQVRNRAGMPPRPATLDNILTERLLELVWEGWRRQDLIRFGKFHKSYDMRTQLPEESNGYTTVFPIPHRSIELNGNLKQNYGYR